MESIITYIHHTPFGDLTLGSYGNNLCLCLWKHGKNREKIIKHLCKYLHTNIVEGFSDTIGRAAEELGEYFDGKRLKFTLPLLFTGTDFQCNVWSELQKIPFGYTSTYSQIADNIGNHQAVRATAQAISKNPLSIIVPCHRIIGKNNKLIGYEGGLDIKQYLLKLEGVLSSNIL